MLGEQATLLEACTTSEVGLNPVFSTGGMAAHCDGLFWQRISASLGKPGSAAGPYNHVGKRSDLNSCFLSTQGMAVYHWHGCV